MSHTSCSLCTKGLELTKPQFTQVLLIVKVSSVYKEPSILQQLAMEVAIHNTHDKRAGSNVSYYSAHFIKDGSAGQLHAVILLCRARDTMLS